LALVPDSPSGHVRAVDKAMVLLEALAEESRGLSLAELAKRTGFNSSSAHHLLATFKRRGFVDQDPETRTYRLGYRLVSLVHEFVSESDVYSAGAGRIRELRDASGDTAFLTALQDQEKFVVFEAAGHHPVQTSRPRLSSQPSLHSTASGKTLLAFLPSEQLAHLIATMPLTKFTPNTIDNREDLAAELTTIRRQGYALDREEWLVGLFGIAAPTFDRHERFIATASVAFPAVHAERLDKNVQLVLDCAAKISTALGYIPGTRRGEADEAVA
jgi:DNA-binding IclR family transcriptional regulator